MGLFYVTGTPGSGKSTLRKELGERGYLAIDLDGSGLGGPHNKQTGERVTFPPADERSPAWFEAHEWRVYPEAVERLRAEAAAQYIILCGVASTDGVVLHLFDQVLYLRMDDDTLRRRIAARSARPDTDFGKNAFEVAEILRRKQALDSKYSASSDVAEIDATGSIRDVADQIVECIRQGSGRTPKP